MISSKKSRFLFALVLVLACGVLAATEPNDGKLDVKIEISDEARRWIGDESS